MRNKEIKLKPCPFCGGEAELIGDQYPYIECSSCRVSFSSNHEYEYDHQSAADRWNERHVPPRYCGHCSNKKLPTHNTEVGPLCDDCYQDACNGGL
ncbi:hypothetical protein VVYB158_13220 [Vibrio vulnificus CladeA-yb158]|uniref:Lar family restriction alleviation protein n=1 Tax=Vibrio vulnificus TaxID=672 RepID=UPI0005C3D7DE|nr:hypothetical protein VVYB158_13220 [Vibrio vulnificus CladeA-yb158]KOR97292.1 hypothetical protein LO82_13745 [Vibrio vulnificus]HAS3542206.1 restriction alleviation protein, Lar family [Vibrio cholerae]HDY7453039.1 Lar family restriction alleviation protein [Vibrio vulnificus]HDY8174777.1 Lar family restriction alleviation protein [Vibrio vulnificus]